MLQRYLRRCARDLDEFWDWNGDLLKVVLAVVAVVTTTCYVLY